MTEKTVTSRIDKRGVAHVILSNPEKHNAFDDNIIAQLTKAFGDIASNGSVRVMVLSSSGKSFSAGADLNWMKRMASYSYEENLRDAHALADMLQALNFMPQPTIARVQGAAFGGAVGLVSCCDMAVGSTRARFSLSEVKIGLIPATISPYVIDAIGKRAAQRYFTTAEAFNADTALQLGLLSEVVVEEALDESVDTLVNHILGNSPAAVRAGKALVFDVTGHAKATSDNNNEAMIAMTCEKIAAIRVSDEGQEGLQAFLEKRPASWLRPASTDQENNNV
ncbi:MAG: enoyl-CoA hydratase/isomerase family protein [Halioglobus sp.]